MSIFDFFKSFSKTTGQSVKGAKRAPTNWREAASQSGYGIKAPKLTQMEELNRCKLLGIKKVTIRTCEDQRVCPECRKHADKTYDLNKAPKIPMCQDCRCLYEPVIT